MIEIRSLIAEIKLEPSDLPLVLLELSKKGWKPALLESQRVFLHLAGVTDKMPMSPIREEVFFQDEDMYYVIMSLGGQVLLERFGFYPRGEREQPQLEVGVVSPVRDGLAERLKRFATMFEEAVKASLDSHKTQEMKFDWHELRIGTPRIDGIIQASEEQGEPSLSRANLVMEEVKAAQLLTSKSTRKLLIELSEAAFAREQDILGRKPKTREEISTALNNLRQAGLLNVEYLLECKQRGTPLTRLRDPQQLNNPEIGALLCPSCGANFSQERLSEGYSLSDLGQKMSSQSHWMTIWVTKLLLELGVPQEAILWNISEAGGEVDLLVEFLGELWIFELKDREFGAGDAYPLNYRQVLYRADRAIVVTTEKVSRDAKRVFDELARGARRPRWAGPVYIEGLEVAKEVLGKEINKAALRYASQKLALISELSGYNLGAILSERFGEPFESQEEDEFEILKFPFYRNLTRLTSRFGRLLPR
jgi:hypothetical protein